MSTVDIDKMLAELKELNMLAHPEYKGACYICGINPDQIQASINEVRTHLKAELLAKMPKKREKNTNISSEPERQSYNMAIDYFTKVVEEL